MVYGPVEDPIGSDLDVYFSVNAVPVLKRQGKMFARSMVDRFLMLDHLQKRIFLNALYVQSEFNLPLTCEMDELTLGFLRDMFPRMRRTTINRLIRSNQYEFKFEFRKER